MELIGSLFLILALALIVAMFITRPFLMKAPRSAKTDGTAEDHLRSGLLAERDRVLNALQELDFDYALGKVPADEYPNMRASLLKTGTEVLRKLDELQVGIQREQVSAEDRIEEVVASRRADAVARQKQREREPAAAVAGAMAGASTNGSSNSKRVDEIEELIASRKRQRIESAAGFCPNCGKPAQKSDKFCSKCGASL